MDTASIILIVLAISYIALGVLNTAYCDKKMRDSRTDYQELKNQNLALLERLQIMRAVIQENGQDTKRINENCIKYKVEIEKIKEEVKQLKQDIEVLKEEREIYKPLFESYNEFRKKGEVK